MQTWINAYQLSKKSKVLKKKSYPRYLEFVYIEKKMRKKVKFWYLTYAYIV